VPLQQLTLLCAVLPPRHMLHRNPAPLRRRIHLHQHLRRGCHIFKKLQDLFVKKDLF
jgi:hypothetical protein